MRQRVFLITFLLCMMVQGVLAWDGSGTSTDPYLIKSSDATFGGLVAVVVGTCTASPVIKKYQ